MGKNMPDRRYEHVWNYLQVYIHWKQPANEKSSARGNISMSSNSRKIARQAEGVKLARILENAHELISAGKKPRKFTRKISRDVSAGTNPRKEVVRDSLRLFTTFPAPNCDLNI